MLTPEAVDPSLKIIDEIPSRSAGLDRGMRGRGAMPPSETVEYLVSDYRNWQVKMEKRQVA